jgi:hypothetical protein
MARFTFALLGAYLATGLVACSSDDSTSPSQNAPDGSSSNTTMTTGGGSAGSGGGGGGSMNNSDASTGAAGSGSAGSGGGGGGSMNNSDASTGAAGQDTTEAATTPPVDAAKLGDADAQGDSGARSRKDYQCNLVMGVSVTYDWFTSGFEAGVDNNRWEAMAPSQALVSFIQMWNDPSNQLWSMAKVSPCTQHPDAPDRVIFTGVNWDYKTAAEWVTQLEKMVSTLQAKFPAVKEIDLMTMLRAPNNVSCGSTETVVQPFIDEASATVAGKHPGLVEIAPKFYAPNCNVFTGGGPHFTDQGKQTIAKVYSDYYAQEP